MKATFRSVSSRALLVISLALAFVPAAQAARDPLPSWNAGAAKRAIVDFVKRVTTPGRKDFVPKPERIATFDNDGTLWAEQPIYFQFQFALDRVKALDEANAKGWTVVSMKDDWKTIFPLAR